MKPIERKNDAPASIMNAATIISASFFINEEIDERGDMRSKFWWDLSAKDFSGLDMERHVAIVPVGAVETHGPHLPVRVDAAINEGIVARAIERLPANAPVLVLPALPIGKSNEHIAFPGTLTLGYETLARVWIEVAESVRRTGCRKILFFNSHGGQPQVMEIVCRELRIRHEMLAVGASWFRTIDLSDLFSQHELTHGIHGGEVETSVMLHLHSELVDMSVARDFVPTTVALAEEAVHLMAEGGAGFGWQTQDLHPSGACGNAAAADATRGRIVVDRAADALVKLLAEIIRYPLDRIVRGTEFNELRV